MGRRLEASEFLIPMVNFAPYPTHPILLAKLRLWIIYDFQNKTFELTKASNLLHVADSLTSQQSLARLKFIESEGSLPCRQNPDPYLHSGEDKSSPHLCNHSFNPLTPNDPYSGRTAPLTSKRCILYIYSTNKGTEYSKHAIYSPFFLFKMQFDS